MEGPAPDRAVGRYGRIAAWAVVALAGALRLADLDRRPLHHDEGSNAIFLLRLLREGVYRYDPTNYHGPTLCYFSALPVALFGTTTAMLRLVPALLGTALVGMVLPLRRVIGARGATVAALLLAVSPSFVYYSRDNIHETYFVFFTLLVVVGLVQGSVATRPWWLVGCGVAAGLLAATKETAALTLAVLGAALLASRGAGLRRPPAARLAAAGLAAVAAAAAVFSRGFTEPRALLEPAAAIAVWARRAFVAGGHAKPWSYFLTILAREEWGILAAGVAGAALAVRLRDRFGLFLAAWAAAILLAYSAFPYKTPWLVLNAALPLALLAGSAFEGGLRRPGPRWGRVAASLVLAGTAIASLARAVDLSFVRYDDPAASRLVYVQTSREVLRLVARVEERARRDPQGRSLSIQILSPDYLPLNWYLRDYTRVAYYGSLIERPDGAVVIARSDAADEVARRLGPGYDREEYVLRPGVRLCLFLRRPSADL